jgi:cellulose synthase/poly-beta-1,6-N-acetylglucosamine synthase-like glycosyltransferase
MIEILGVVFFIFLALYGAMLVFFARGWQLGTSLGYSTRDKVPEGQEGDARATGHLQPWVTVLVACRNETHRMTPLLKALVEQEVSFGWELLWIDDFSDDDSVAMVKSFLANHPQLDYRLLLRNGTDPFPPHKKGAIAWGVEQAKGRWVLVTDADCVPGPRWIATMIRPFLYREGLAFVAGPVRLWPAQNRWEKSQALEFMSLNAIAASTLALGRPVISNGGNMAFDRQVFLDCSPYDSNWKHPGGDDDMLMHRIHQHCGPEGLVFCRDQAGMVDTRPVGPWRDFLAQRIRWISKQGAYPDPAVSRILKTVWLMHALLFSSIVVGIASGNLTLLGMATMTWFFKAGMDGLYTRLVARFYGAPAGWGLLFWTQLWYLPYTLIAGLAGYRGKFKWKGRQYG